MTASGQIVAVRAANARARPVWGSHAFFTQKNQRILLGSIDITEAITVRQQTEK